MPISDPGPGAGWFRSGRICGYSPGVSHFCAWPLWGTCVNAFGRREDGQPGARPSIDALVYAAVTDAIRGPMRGLGEVADERGAFCRLADKRAAFVAFLFELNH
jgi:hypothetical protein